MKSSSMRKVISRNMQNIATNCYRYELLSRFLPKLKENMQDDAMLFITVKSSEAEQVPKVLQVVEETKRIRYKAGLSVCDIWEFSLISP